MELWASSMILSWSSSTLGTHNIPWYLNTTSPLVQKSSPLLTNTCLQFMENRILVLFLFIFRHQWWFNPIHHHYLSLESIRWTSKHASLCTSFAYFFLSSLKWIVLPIDNLLKVPTKTLSLLGWLENIHAIVLE